MPRLKFRGGLPKETSSLPYTAQDLPQYIFPAPPATLSPMMVMTVVAVSEPIDHPEQSLRTLE